MPANRSKQRGTTTTTDRRRFLLATALTLIALPRCGGRTSRPMRARRTSPRSASMSAMRARRVGDRPPTSPVDPSPTTPARRSRRPTLDADHRAGRPSPPVFIEGPASPARGRGRSARRRTESHDHHARPATAHDQPDRQVLVVDSTPAPDHGDQPRQRPLAHVHATACTPTAPTAIVLHRHLRRDRRPHRRADPGRDQPGDRTRRPAIRELCSIATALAPRRDLGQNFVADPNTVRRIARLAASDPATASSRSAPASDR